MIQVPLHSHPWLLSLQLPPSPSLLNGLTLVGVDTTKALLEWCPCMKHCPVYPHIEYLSLQYILNGGSQLPVLSEALPQLVTPSPLFLYKPPSSPYPLLLR